MNKKPLTLDSYYDIKILSEKDLIKVISKNKLTKKIYDVLTEKIIPKLEKLNIKTFLIPLPRSPRGMYWSDFAYDYVRDKYNVDLLSVDHMFFTFYLNEDGNEINENSEIAVNYSELSLPMKKKVIKLFEKYLFQQFSWSGSNKRAMYLKLKKDDTILQIDTTKLKEDDTYPLLQIEAKTKISLLENKDKLYDILNFLETVIDEDTLFFDCGNKDIEIVIYSIPDEKTLINKIKNHIKKIKYLKDIKITFIEKSESKKIL